MMTPDEMTEYLRAMRKEGLLSAELTVPGRFTLRAVFGPDLDSPPGDPIDKEPEPGAWKWKGEQP